MTDRQWEACISMGRDRGHAIPLNSLSPTMRSTGLRMELGGTSPGGLFSRISEPSPPFVRDGAFMNSCSDPSNS